MEPYLLQSERWCCTPARAADPGAWRSTTVAEGGAPEVRCFGRARWQWRTGAPVSAEPWKGLPKALGPIRAAIDESCKLLDLADDWDGEGSRRIPERVWRRATLFLVRYAKHLWETEVRCLDAPDILPGPDGSVDLHWNYPGYEILVNVPREEAALAGFYGDDRGRATIKGKFDPASMNEGLLSWLKRTS